jgi:hypothetical protein
MESQSFISYAVRFFAQMVRLQQFDYSRTMKVDFKHKLSTKKKMPVATDIFKVRSLSQVSNFFYHSKRTLVATFQLWGKEFNLPSSLFGSISPNIVRRTKKRLRILFGKTNQLPISTTSFYQIFVLKFVKFLVSALTYIDINLDFQ